MDYKDYQAGATKEFFWHRAKIQFIEVLLNKLEKGEKLRILNLGAGTGDDLPVISQFGDVYIIDIDSNALRMVSDKFVYEKKVCDACHLPYPDNFFDLALAFDVLEHIESDSQAVSEVHRVLKSDGRFIFTVPAFSFLYSAHDRALHHFRRYNVSTIKGRLSQFELLESGFWVFSLFLPVAVQKLIKRRASEDKVHFMKLPAPINSFFYYLLKIETYLIKHGISLPVGITIYGIYQKKSR